MKNIYHYSKEISEFRECACVSTRLQLKQQQKYLLSSYLKKKKSEKKLM